MSKLPDDLIEIKEDIPDDLVEVSLLDDLIEAEKVPQGTIPPISQKDLAKKIIPQLITGIAEQVPFGRRITDSGRLLPAGIPLEQIPTPQGIPAKIARSAGSMIGMMPSFSVGGIGGGAVGRTVTQKLVTQLPRLAKYLGAAAGGATTFTTARALRNIAQNQPIQTGLPEEVTSGAIFGPTGLIKGRIPATVTAASLAALTAPEGEKLSSAILFGGVSLFTHQRPDLSAQDKANIDRLYSEATFNEGLRTFKARINQPAQLQLPAPATIYGEGFTVQPQVAKLPLSVQKQLGYKQPAQLEYRPTLEKGAIRQGEGFTVTGGKQIARPLAKGAMEIRTTLLPEEIIAKVQPQVQKDIQEARIKGIVSGVVVTPKDLEPISKELVIGIPKFKSTDEAIAFGKQYAGNTQVLQKLQEKRNRILAENEKIKALENPTNEQFKQGYNNAVEAQFYREALEGAKEVSITAPKAEVMDISVPAVSKNIGIIKPGKAPYIQREGKILGLKPEKHLLSPQEKIELQNKLAEAYSFAPKEGTKGTVNIQVGNWQLKLENNREKLTNFSNIVSKRGSVVIPQEFFEPIIQTGTKIYRGFAPPAEVLRDDKGVNSMMAERQRMIAEVQSGKLPESMVKQRYEDINNVEKEIVKLKEGDRGSTIRDWTVSAILKESAFINRFMQIVHLANKVGITEGSKPAEIIFKALDYRRALPEEITALTPTQQKFIPIIRNAFKEMWAATGKTEYEGIRDYATHLIQTGKEIGYDISPFGRFLPDELYSRFFEKRKGAQPYTQDIIKALDVYIPNVARKIFREPVLQEYNKLDRYFGRDFRNEATDFMEAFLGRGRYRGEEVLGRLPRGLVRLTYRGTLYGNLSAATKNATQVLTNSIPELGYKNVEYGYRKLMTPEGRREFINSGLSGEFTLNKSLDQLDFFSQIEFVNKGVTYLAAKRKALTSGKGLIQAEQYAAKEVDKTQFTQVGFDVPKLYRHYGALGRIAGQFTQFPTKQGFLIYNWAKHGEWNKVAKFATIAYLLGGTRTVPFLDGIIDGDYKALPQMPEETKKLLRKIELYTTVPGVASELYRSIFKPDEPVGKYNLDIGQNFGLGIYSSGVPFARGPVASMVSAEIPDFIRGIATHRITNLQDIIRSRLVQKSLPTLIPGGVAMKKVIDLINADENDYKIRNAYNQLNYISSPEEETLRILVGPTKERKESWGSIFKEQKEAEIYRNEHRKMLDFTLDSKGDWLGLEEFYKKYPQYDLSRLPYELIERAKKRDLPKNIREYLIRPKALR